MRARLKKLLALCVLVVMPGTLSAQQITSAVYFGPVNTVSDAACNSELMSPTAYHQLKWTNTGTVTACTVLLDDCNGNVIIAAQDCSASGTSAVVSSVVAGVRVRITAFTGTGMTWVSYSGYSSNPGGGGGGSGTVTSVSAGNLSPLFTASVATPTTTPALSFALSSQTSNQFFAAPDGSSGNPGFRAIVGADLPNLTGDVTTSGSAATTIAANAVSYAKLQQVAANSLVGNATGSTANATSVAVTNCTDSSGQHLNWTAGSGFGCGTSSSNPGTVTSFSAGNLSPLFTSSVATASSTPALSFSQVSQLANLIFASPNGSSGNPGFRALVGADLPNLTGDVTTSGSAATTIAANAVSYAKLQQVAANSLVGNATGSTANATSVAVANCTDSGGQHLNWTAGSGFSCGTTSSSSGGNNSGFIGYSGIAGGVLSSTMYFPLSGGLTSSTTEANVQQAAPQAATIANLFVQVSTAPGTGNSYVITLRDAAASKALTCTISGTATACNDQTHSFTPAQGDLLDWQVAPTGTVVTTPNVMIAAQWGGSITTGSVNSGTSGDLASYPSTGTTVGDSGVVAANVVTASSAAAGAKQVCTSSGASKSCTYIDFPDVKFVPAANCNNATAGNGWSIGSGGTVTCRAGTNNQGGYVAITDTSSTFAQFAVAIPEDWDSGSNPYIRFQVASTDTTSGHTIIPQIKVTCAKGDGTTTDDVSFNAAHSSSTITLNTTANQLWSSSSVQMNSTDMTGCVAGALMVVQVGRATDTATNAEFYGATVTFPRLIVVQAN